MRWPVHGGGDATTELIENTATALAAMVRGGEVSAREVVHAYLERIEAHNGDLNAIVTLRADEALVDADGVDRRLARGGADDLPLAGVPFTVKDLIATRGVRTTAGTPFLRDWVPRADATAVARLRDAGGVLLGKTNCPEWGMFPYTLNSLFGATKNPIDPSLTPGGSSGGESAAVAAGLSALGVGTDFGGSLRWPAHCTGVFALRPTAGRIPSTGQLPTPSLDEPLIPNEVTLQGRVQVVGPLARSADDLELALRVMSGPDGWDPFAPPAALRSSRDARVAVAAVWNGPAEPPTRPDVAAVARRAGVALEDQGFDVADEAPAMLDDAGPLYSELRDTDRLQDVRRLVRGHEDRIGEDVRAAIRAAEAYERRGDGREPAAVWEARDRMRAGFEAYLNRHRVLLMPVATVPAFGPATEPPPVGGREQSIWDVLAPCRLISLFGFPAASVPFGVSSEGLPVGVQVVGRPFREDEVLAVARALMDERMVRERR
jgi:Asp-tRNA(Asn)/Glu-tRNA(Gln) amidotransferase A subunit family amidase